VTGLRNDLVPDENPLEVSIRSEGLMKPSKNSFNDRSPLSLEESKKKLDISIQSAFESIRINQEKFDKSSKIK
jgi:hypothetical protein